MQGTLGLPPKHSLPTHHSRRRTMPVRAAVADIAPPSRSSSARSRSLYEVLRVTRNASQVEIKTAYRALAKVFHPDATSRFMDPSDDGGDFIEIHRAYATLSDPDARAIYDLDLSVGGISGHRRAAGRGRWETDQCW